MSLSPLSLLQTVAAVVVVAVVVVVVVVVAVVVVVVDYLHVLLWCKCSCIRVVLNYVQYKCHGTRNSVHRIKFSKFNSLESHLPVGLELEAYQMLWVWLERLQVVVPWVTS